MSEHELAEIDDDGGGGELLIPGPAPLTPREEQFCIAFGDPESTTYGRSEKSAAAAGYVQPRSAAWKLRRRPKIQARLAEFQAAATAAAGKVLSDLEHTRLAALDKGDLATAARCSELAGKHLGLFLENSIVTLADQADRPRYDARVAEDMREITAFLIMKQTRSALPEAQHLGADVPAGTNTASQDGSGPPPTPALDQSIEAPARATAAELATLEQAQTQEPQERQESE